ncbi:M48 family metallopeptidase [Caulobacter sp. KR2-114]|uniref:M48 family metallopeptidase n=1 Tax=Caulobacter sp. KR2-114 TaxID=3400912 RepID=UPI003C09D47F
MALLRRDRYADGQQLDVSGAPVRLKTSARARRISLRVDRVTGEVLAIAPNARLLGEAVAFAHERHHWIVAQLRALPPRTTLAAAGDTVSVFGQPCRLIPGPGRPRFVPPSDDGGEAQITGCGRETIDHWTAGRVIRREAERVFAARVKVHADALGAPMPKVSTADARGRWGSCTPGSLERRASIRLSWRLALAPFDVADYVVAHECAHLKEANHGPRFWALVRQLVGDPAPFRAWLRAEGPRLHAFGREI